MKSMQGESSGLVITHDDLRALRPPTTVLGQ
jgi:hypothetical protein